VHQPDPPIVTDEEREFFDALLEQVLADLPNDLHKKLEVVPVIVEDYPSDDVLAMFGMQYPDELCGLHEGIPLTERSVEHSGSVPDIIMIYREGIFATATDARGDVDEHALRRQIRITLLHEIGHHFGLTEDDLRELGYG